MRKMAAIATMLLVSGCFGKEETTATTTTPTPAASAAPNMTVKGAIADADAVRVRPASVAPITGMTTGIDPGVLKIKTYKVGFSTSEDCSSPTAFSISDTPEYQDWMVAPTLGTGDLADGTYPCVIMEIGSLIKYSAVEDSDGGLCVADEEVEMDLCPSGGSSTLIDGTVTECGDDDNDRIAIYISTGGFQGDDCQEGCGMQPDFATYLISPLVVSGTSTGIFKLGALGKVGEFNTGPQGSAVCAMDEPSWDFE